MSARRLALTLIASKAWMGGFNYQINLATSLLRYERDNVQPVVFCGVGAEESDVLAFSQVEGLELVRDAAFDAPSRRQGLRAAILTGRDSAAIECFTRHRIDVLFENATFYGWRCPLPAIAWFPDFQHRHMPELFSKTAWWRREVGFRAQVLSGRTVLLSSEDSRRDCERAFPTVRGRTAVLRFPALLDPRSLPADPVEVLAQYRLPDAFAFLPNQFWAHKNHALVIEALGQLRQADRPVTVVATGNPADPRHPDHLASIERQAETLGVSGDWRMLGAVPRTHLLALLATCSVLVNPSRFEGWSTTVEEAKALGVPMLLSDLGVHREQAGEEAWYFLPDDAAELAHLLDAHARTRPQAARGVVPAMAGRGQEFAARFAGIVLRAAGRERPVCLP